MQMSNSLTEESMLVAIYSKMVPSLKPFECSLLCPFLSPKPSTDVQFPDEFPKSNICDYQMGLQRTSLDFLVLFDWALQSEERGEFAQALAPSECL